MFNEYNFHNYINSLNKYFLINKNSAYISNKLIFITITFFKYMKTNFNLKPSQEYTNILIKVYHYIIKNKAL